MIQKPPSEWQRGATPLENAVDTAPSFARGGATAVRTGSRIGTAVVCWAFALLWGFCALGGVAMGNVPMAVGVGLMAAGMAWAGKRAYAKTRADAPHHVSASIPAGARALREVRYSRPKLVVAVITGIILAWIGGQLVHGARGLGLLAFGIIMVAGPIFALLAAVKLFGDPVALAWDGQTITIATLRKRRTVRRAELVSIKVWTRTTYAYGVVPIRRTTTLTIATRNSGRFAMRTGLLDLDGRSLADLAAELERWRTASSPAPAPVTVRGSGRPAPSASPATSHPGRDGAFDADAIIARYLADKTALEAADRGAVAQPRKAVFGRKSS